MGQPLRVTNLQDACTVRAAHHSDLVAVLGVYAQRDQCATLPGQASVREEQTWARMVGTADLTVYLAELNGVAVGTATLLIMPNLTYQCAPTAFIEAVVVAFDYRRRGIATHIIKRILDDTRAAGCNKIQLLSHKRHVSDGAHRLYTRLGFEAEAEGFRLYQRQVPAAVQAARS
jgi:GNAT superfamily N-acetyltransferase